MAGHSKWIQIKHKKTINDARKGQLFSKLVREIMIAARNGGTLSETNTHLQRTIERARASGLPKENIERAIIRASGEEKGRELQEFLYEATAPYGINMLIEGITDNKNRTLAGIRKLLRDHEAKLADPGSILWNFDKIGIIKLLPDDNPKKTKEELELETIEAGARDFIYPVKTPSTLQTVQGKIAGGERTAPIGWPLGTRSNGVYADDILIIETDFTDLEKVRSALEKNGIKVKETGHDYKPRMTTTLKSGEKENLDKLITALLKHDDIQKVYTNLEE